jgi:hypothetical protein
LVLHEFAVFGDIFGMSIGCGSAADDSREIDERNANPRSRKETARDVVNPSRPAQ